MYDQKLDLNQHGCPLEAASYLRCCKLFYTLNEHGLDPHREHKSNHFIAYVMQHQG